MGLSAAAAAAAAAAAGALAANAPEKCLGCFCFLLHLLLSSSSSSPSGEGVKILTCSYKLIPCSLGRMSTLTSPRNWDAIFSIAKLVAGDVSHALLKMKHLSSYTL